MKCKIVSVLLVVFSLLILLFEVLFVSADPVGPTISYKGNTTMNDSSAATMNYTGTGNIAGGYIYTANLNSNQKNPRWKAYVGNVTGTLVLQDAEGYSIYDWSIATALTGEVYATRSSTTISWSTIACATNSNVSNEMVALNHTNLNDNISTTFAESDNDQFVVGTTTIGQNTCNTTNLYVNGSAPTADEWEEVLLHDGDNMVYTAIIEQDLHGFDGNQSEANSTTYDFQLMLPEDGSATWASSTAYYFYVELT